MTDHHSTKYQLRIPVALKTTLDEAATERRITPSQLVRLAIVAYLELPTTHAQMQPPPLKPKEKARRANDRRKIALKALRHLQRTNPALLEELAKKMQNNEGAA